MPTSDDVWRQSATTYPSRRDMTSASDWGCCGLVDDDDDDCGGVGTRPHDISVTL